MYRDRRGQAATHPVDRPDELADSADNDLLALGGGLEISWAIATRIWWSLAWRLSVVTSMVVFSLGVMAGAYLHFVGGSWQLEIVGIALAMLTAVPVGIWAVKSVLAKDFPHFRLLLLPSDRALIERHQSIADRR